MSRGGKQAYLELFHEVRAVLNRHDPMQLIALGAPDDEYEPEVEALLPHLARATSIENVEQSLERVWMTWFGQVVGPDAPAIAADIWDAARRFRARTADPER